MTQGYINTSNNSQSFIPYWFSYILILVYPTLTTTRLHELFNQFFSLPLLEVTLKSQILYELCSPNNSLDAIHLTKPDVFNALVNLNPHKATGIDKIVSSALKTCACALVAPLCHLFATSLDTSVIPTEWKTHMIILVYKSSDKKLLTYFFVMECF